MSHNLLPWIQGCLPVCERYCVTAAATTITIPLLNTLLAHKVKEIGRPHCWPRSSGIPKAAPLQGQPWHWPDFSVSKKFQATPLQVVSFLALEERAPRQSDKLPLTESLKTNLRLLSLPPDFFGTALLPRPA